MRFLGLGLADAPKQRNSDGEKRDIKAGRIPEAWKDKERLAGDAQLLPKTSHIVSSILVAAAASNPSPWSSALESAASLLEATLNETRAELARRSEPPDSPIPFNDPKITRIR